jgi:preprotein translocase subunit YajC
MKKNIIYLTFLLGGTPAFGFAQSSSGQGSDPTQFLIMIVMFFAIFYFIVIRPQQKEQKQHQARINNLQKNDRVITSGGIHGTIRATKEKTVVVEIADGVKVTVNRQAITAVLDSTSSKGRSSDDEEGEE